MSTLEMGVLLVPFLVHLCILMSGRLCGFELLEAGDQIYWSQLLMIAPLFGIPWISVVLDCWSGMQPEEMGYNPFLFSRLHAVDLEFIDWRRESNLSVLTICVSGILWYRRSIVNRIYVEVIPNTHTTVTVVQTTPQFWFSSFACLSIWFLFP